MDFKNYFLLLCSLFIFYLAGHIIFRLARLKEPSNLHFSLFTKFLVGTTAFVFIYSLFITRGATVNLGFVVIAFISWYMLKKENLLVRKINLFSFKINKTTALILVETLVIATGWYIWSDHHYWNNPYALTHKDMVFYAKLSEYLNLTHYENWFTVLNLFDEQYHGTTAYHYYELWLTAGYAKIFSGLTLTGYVKFTMPLLLTVTSIGVIALFKIYFNHNYFNLLLPLLLFAQGIYVTDFLTEIEAWLFNPVSYPKFISVYMMLIMGLFLLIKRKNLFFIPFLCIPVVSISCALPVFSSLVLLALVSIIFKNKLLSKETSRHIIVFALIVFAFIAAFYSLTGVREKNVLSTMDLDFILKNLKTAINIFGATSLQIAYLYVIYFVAFLLLLYYLKNKFQNYLLVWGILLASVYMISLASWAVLFSMRHSIQLFQNNAIPFLNVTVLFLFIFLAHELKKSKIQLYYLTVCLMFINCGWILLKSFNSNIVLSPSFDSNSKEYIEKISEVVKTKPMNPLGVFFLGREQYSTIVGAKVSSFYTLGDYLKLMKSGYNTISLSIYDMPLSPPGSGAYLDEQQLLESAIFYRFTEKQKALNHFTSVDSSQIEFIKTYNINYGIASDRAVLSPLLKSIVEREIIDEKSGERFMIFRN